MSDSVELNLGSDWEQSKSLLVHWHKRFEKTKSERDSALKMLEEMAGAIQRTGTA